MKRNLIVYSLLFLAALYGAFYLIDFSEGNTFKRVKSTGSKKATVESKKGRADYFFNMLRDPATNSIPKNIRAMELQFAKMLPKSEDRLKKDKNAKIATWAEAGPYDVGGRTRALAFDLNDSQTILAGGVSGGIWKSTNGGGSWTMKSSVTGQLAVTSIAQDPRPGYRNIWYYTAGEFDGNSARDQGGKAMYYGNGIYKSIDNGETWNLITSTAGNPNSWDSYFDYVSKIAVHPTSGSVYAASHGFGIVKSSNGGTDWSLVLGAANDHYYSDVIILPNGTVIASISDFGYNAYYANPTKPHVNSPGIYKSTNDGGNWTDITPASYPATHLRTVIEYAPSNPQMVYAFTNTGYYDGNDNEITGLFKINTTTGEYWDRSANVPSFDDHGIMNTQGCYNMVIGVKPNDENFVLIGATNLYKSTDGFATKPADARLGWIGGYHPVSFFYPNAHPDFHSIVFDLNQPNRVILGHDGGLSTTSDITQTSYATYFPWVSLNNGYNVTQFYTVALKATAGDNNILGGTQDNGTPGFRYTGSSTSPSEDMSSGDGSFCYLGTNYAYTSSQLGTVLRLGIDANGNPNWNSGWTEVTPSSATGQMFINPFRVDPANEDYMYYLGGADLWRNRMLSSYENYQQGGVSLGWTKLTNFAAPAGYKYTTLEVSKTNSASVLYLGAYSSSGVPKMYKVSNATTATSGIVDISVSGVVSGAFPHDIAVNPNNSNEIIAVFSNYNITGIYYSNNGGTDWTAVEGNLTGNVSNPGPSIRSACIVPSAGGTTYLVGTSTGLYSTTALNGGSTVWAQEGLSNIGYVVVADLDHRVSDGKVVAATHGRGAFVSTNVVVGTEDDSQMRPEVFALAQNYPNPFNPSTKINFTLPEAGQVSLKVFDISGREVAVLVNEYKNRGAHNVSFNASNLASGVYLYTLKHNNKSVSRKMILAK